MVQQEAEGALDHPAILAAVAVPIDPHRQTDCHTAPQQLNFHLRIMALTTEEVRKIASLARLRFTPGEESVFVEQLGRIVDYIDQISQIPQLQTLAGEEGAAAPTPVREAEDIPRPVLPREQFLANAPASAFGEFLAVPEVKGGADE
jgi:aspartyl-tRNA(Asn)/glutamyl-tRNA(Gln) amidotransferase subunit C